MSAHSQSLSLHDIRTMSRDSNDIQSSCRDNNLRPAWFIAALKSCLFCNAASMLPADHETAPPIDDYSKVFYIVVGVKIN